MAAPSLIKELEPSLTQLGSSLVWQLCPAQACLKLKGPTATSQLLLPFMAATNTSWVSISQLQGMTQGAQADMLLSQCASVARLDIRGCLLHRFPPAMAELTFAVGSSSFRDGSEHMKTVLVRIQDAHSLRSLRLVAGHADIDLPASIGQNLPSGLKAVHVSFTVGQAGDLYFDKDLDACIVLEALDRVRAKLVLDVKVTPETEPDTPALVRLTEGLLSLGGIHCLQLDLAHSLAPALCSGLAEYGCGAFVLQLSGHAENGPITALPPCQQLHVVLQ